MNQVGATAVEAVEKFFSAVAEMEDGTKKLVPIRGKSPGAVYQQVKHMPGVRRVGKVSPVSRADFEDLQSGRAPAPQNPPHSKAGNNGNNGKDPKRPESRLSEPPESGEPGEPGDGGRRERWTGHTITGPRVVLHAKPSGGEQPFKHLKPPPERPKPPSPPQPPKAQPPKPVNVPITRPAAQPVAQPTAPAPAQAAVTAQPAAHEYRIVKSRRQEGQPYLLQRGSWGQQKGKRAFLVDWEKGFPRREDAEKHLEWVHRSAREMEELNQHNQHEEEAVEQHV